jgi:hypothetical protein
MPEELPIADPRANAAWRAINAQRIAQLRPEAREPFTLLERRAWEDAGLRVVFLPPVRTDDAQLKLFAQGRELRGGTWVVVDQLRIVTNARTSDQSPHGVRRRAAADVVFLVGDRVVAPAVGVVDSWHASHPWEQLMALAESCRLEAGGRWTGPLRDLDHFQLPGWKTLPLLAA